MRALHGMYSCMHVQLSCLYNELEQVYAARRHMRISSFACFQFVFCSASHHAKTGRTIQRGGGRKGKKKAEKKSEEIKREEAVNGVITRLSPLQAKRGQSPAVAA